MDSSPLLRIRGPVFVCEHDACIWRGQPHPSPEHCDADGSRWPIGLADVGGDESRLPASS